MTGNRESSMGDRAPKRSPIGHEAGSDGDSTERPVEDARDLAATDDTYDDEDILAEDEDYRDSSGAHEDAETTVSPSSANLETTTETEPTAQVSTSDLDAEVEDWEAELLGETDDDILKPAHSDESSGQRTGALSPRNGRLLLIAAVVVGICLGVWFAGRTTVEDRAAAGPSPTATATAKSEAEVEARISELSNELKASPSDIDAHLELGVLLFDSGDLPGAHEHWQKVTTLDPTQVKAWFNLGYYYLSTEPADTKSAIEAWQKVVELEPNSELAIQAGAHIKAMQNSMSSPAATTAPAPSAGGG